jgi:hypothetical protein
MVTTKQPEQTLMIGSSVYELQNWAKKLDEFFASLMQKGTDYDVIPGTPKPTLLKSGAEMLRLGFGFNPEFKISKGLTDIQKGFIEYDVVCSLYKNGALVAEGVGNANSLESKWRYRWIFVNELPPGFDKEKAYKTYGATRKTKQGGYQYRIENENPQDQANTILKIAKKRAFVDAILTATGASRIFTQDIEDMEMVPEARPAPVTPQKQDSTQPEGHVNPVVEAAVAAGGTVIAEYKQLSPSINTKLLEFCTEHDEALWEDGRYGKQHRSGSGYCNLKDAINTLADKIAMKVFETPAFEIKKTIDKVTKKETSRTYPTEKFYKFLQDKQAGAWSQLQPEQKLDLLAMLENGDA